MTSRTLTSLVAATLGIAGLASAQMTGQDHGTGTMPQKSMPTGASQTDPSQTNANATQAADAPAPTDPKATDKNFVQKAVSAGLYEVAAAKLVQTKASDPQIRQLAETMESDHKQTNAELTKIAKQSNIDVPTSPQGADQQMLVQLRESGDEQLGQQYLSQQIQAHQQSIDLFKQVQLQDPTLKAFAQRTLPKLEEHLKHLQQMSSSAQPAGAAMPGSTDTPSTPDKNKPAPAPAPDRPAPDKPASDNTPNFPTPNP